MVSLADWALTVWGIVLVLWWVWMHIRRISFNWTACVALAFVPLGAFVAVTVWGWVGPRVGHWGPTRGVAALLGLLARGLLGWQGVSDYHLIARLPLPLVAMILMVQLSPKRTVGQPQSLYLIAAWVLYVRCESLSATSSRNTRG